MKEIKMKLIDDEECAIPMVPFHLKEVYSGAYAVASTIPVKGINYRGKETEGTIIFVPIHPDYILGKRKIDDC